MKVGFFDLEANGLLREATKVHCGVVKQQGQEALSKYGPSQVKELLKHLDTFDVLIAHNGTGYDFPLLEKLYKWKFRGKVVDTLIMSRLLDPKRLVPFNCPDKGIGPHGLEAWGYRVGRGKPAHDDWENYSEEMLHRCSEDVEILELVYNKLLEESKGGKWKKAFQMSFELFTHLQKQEEYGWLVDRPHMDRCINQLSRWIGLIDRVVTPKLPRIIEIEETKKGGEYNYIRKPFLKSGAYSQSVIDWCASSGWSPSDKPVVGCFSRISFRFTDLNSNAETKDFLLSLGWEPLEWNTDDDGNRTSPKLSKDDPFEGIENKLGRLVAKRVQCRQRRGIIEGLCKLIREDGRIASVVNTLAVTGRATHRNIVNIPKAGSFYGKQMRRIFTSKDGFVLVGTDSDANQIRNLVSRMNDEGYKEVVLNGVKEKGTDIHTVNMKAAGLSNRDQAKTFFYGWLFGAGDAKIGKIVKGDSVTGKKLKTQFLEGLPALGKLIESLNKEWRATAKQRYNPKFNRMEYYNGVVTGLDGRPIKVPSEHQILVYILQSDEAVVMSKAYCLASKILNEKYIWGVDYGIVCFMHDEFTVECREDIAEDVKLISENSIKDAAEFFNMNCPHKGSGQIGKDWYSIH